MNNTVTIDFTESLAKTETTCDACSKSLGRGYAYKRGAMAFYLSDGDDEYGEPTHREYHVCGESCARDLLNSRSKK